MPRSSGKTFRCELCGADTAVTDSRACSDPVGIRRRRQCQSSSCAHRFLTYELSGVDEFLTWMDRKDRAVLQVEAAHATLTALLEDLT